MVKLHGALHAAFLLHGILARDDGGARVVELDNLRRRGKETLQVVDEHAERAHRVRQRPAQRVKECKRAD